MRYRRATARLETTACQQPTTLALLSLKGGRNRCRSCGSGRERLRALGAGQVGGLGRDQTVRSTIPPQGLSSAGGAREPEAQSPGPHVRWSWTPVGFRAVSGDYPEDNNQASASEAAQEAGTSPARVPKNVKIHLSILWRQVLAPSTMPNLLCVR